MMFSSLNNLLEHIKEVERDTIQISQSAQMKLSNFIEEKNIELTDEATEALQYQDIVSQQLSATVEAISLVQKSIQIFAHNFEADEKLIDENSLKLRKKLDDVLSEAKAKKEAFSGNVKDSSNENEIEFF